MGVENTYAAYCLDEAIILWGESLEAELDRVESKAKTEKAAEGAKKLVLEKWLKMGSFSDRPQETEQQFRSPTPTR
jgi:hypothetical protein